MLDFSKELDISIVDGIPVEHNPEIPKEELLEYVKRGKEKYPTLHGLTAILAKDQDGFVDIQYDIQPIPFQRLRRITGYLVGDLKRWNNGKRAEERDRVKHDAGI